MTIWSADPDVMQLINKYRKGKCFLPYLFNFYSKYAWVIPFKDNKCETNTQAFQKISKELNRKPTKYEWVKEVNFETDYYSHCQGIMA